MIFGRENSNGAWETYGGSLAKKLDKELQEDLDEDGSCGLIFGGWKNTGREVFLMGRFGEEERQEDDSVLVVVFVFADCSASC